ncbi:hypothetical protein RhiirA1_410293 [Rhizophagus irregularis]|uniref:MATA-HMG n=1 Tax=Rhizophagus irregularis TaxID=588596 RepID=A0A1B1EVL9_9GLOM|nr:MATA-HMG [Rhizophagus irregularis]ANQ32850.1 MATA-HMG [Rhizophagus irregularis]PKC73637.1 hypothetical protein RhiirA1_410293 [Rhizophagus irregularis]PKY13791.1 hypothetical protein RhiirB3_399404 [Rhizophagus irregularis]CAB4460266.1 unnamed protein product [Rhizophagus irregularis]
MGKFKQQEGRIKSFAHNRIENENKPDEDIVKELSHLLYLDIDELLINSKETRRYKNLKRRGITEFEKPPRLQNIFILYRRNKSASPEFKNKLKVDRKVKLTSKEIGILWKNETEEVKKLFYALERMAKKKHREIYGDNYKPERKKSQPKDRKNKNKKELSMSSSSSPAETSLGPQIHTSQSSTLDELPYLQDDDSQSSMDYALSDLLFEEPASPHLSNNISQFPTNSTLSESRTNDIVSTNSIPPDSRYLINDISQISTNFTPPDSITFSTQYLTNSTNSFGSICSYTQDFVIHYLSDKPYLLVNIKTGQVYFLFNSDLNFYNFVYDYEQSQQVNNSLQSNPDEGCYYEKST